MILSFISGERAGKAELMTGRRTGSAKVPQMFSVPKGLGQWLLSPGSCAGSSAPFSVPANAGSFTAVTAGTTFLLAQ